MAKFCFNVDVSQFCGASTLITSVVNHFGSKQNGMRWLDKSVLASDWLTVILIASVCGWCIEAFRKRKLDRLAMWPLNIYIVICSLFEQ